MKKKKLIIISMIAIIAIVIAALATSYALFNINVTKDKINKIVIGNLQLSLNDNNNTFTDGKIVVNNMIPMKDTTGMQQDGYRFTLTNTGSIDAEYKIYLDDVVISNLPNNITGRVDNSYVRVNLTNTTTNITHTFTLADIPERLLESGTLDSGQSNNFVLRVWLDYSAGNEFQNKYFAAKIRVGSTQKNANPTIAAGLYDENDNLIETYENLVTKYGFDPGTNAGYDFYYDEGWYNSETDELVEFSTIPTSIPYAALAQNEYSSARTLILPEGLTDINDGTFQYLTNIQTIEIPSTVKYVGDDAFTGSSSLTTVKFAANSLLKYIGYEAFEDCTNLTTIILPPALKILDGEMFCNCESLRELTIPASVTEISGLGNLSNLETITFAANSRLETIYPVAFNGCEHLESIIIPASVKTIGDNAFKDCSGLTSVTFEANSKLNSIGETAFTGCSSLDSLTIPNGVTTIGTNAFQDIPHIYYSGTATGSPWGATAIN